MRKPRLASVLLLAVVGAGSWALWPRSVNAESHHHSGPEQAALPRSAVASKASAPATPFVVHFLAPPRPVAGVTLPAGSLSSDDEALLTETAALQQLAASSELELNAHQWAALAAATRKIQAIRQAYEASIATTTLVAPGRYRIDVPAYAAAGDALRAKLQAELRAQLGEANATEVLAQMGSRLEGYFGGFGVSVQSLDVAIDPADGAAGTVTRTMTYWNSVEGRAQLTTRRETYFPGREDPTGELWQPFLALVNARG